MNIENYHLHFYYDEDTVQQAKDLYEKANQLKDIKLGTFHRRPVGPHPKWSFQIAFKFELLNELTSWVMFNRNGLSVLLHACTGQDFIDHTELTSWFGVPLDLDLKRFS